MHSIINVAFFCGVFTSRNSQLLGIVVSPAFAASKSDLSRTFGPHEFGINIIIFANEFKANNIVGRKFVCSENKMASYGCFETKRTRGFNEVTFADGLKEDNNKIYFTDNANNNGAFDTRCNRIYAYVTISCEK